MMETSTLMKNGTINLPASIRKELKLKPGDKLSFIPSEKGYILVPIVDIFSLVDGENMEKAVELIEELHDERRKEALEDNN